MATVIAAPADAKALRHSAERPAISGSGYVMLLVEFVLLALIVAGILLIANKRMIGVPLDLAATFFFVLVIAGFYMLQPNQAVVITLFGDYRGTDRATGLRWVLPWYARKKISARVQNLMSEKLKVNDLRGNPIEIAANVVWRVTDTAQALFDVDKYPAFIAIQVESAVRAIGAKYPYDDFEHHEITLRGNADEVAAELERELQERVARAGITIDEARLTHLAYAQEIAQTMLRRQQAEAVIAARSKIVEGAVTMVENALNLLSEKHVVELDDERRATMVSNLMVVLCSDRDTQPVVNTGTLYQ